MKYCNKKSGVKISQRTKQFVIAVCLMMLSEAIQYLLKHFRVFHNQIFLATNKKLDKQIFKLFSVREIIKRISLQIFKRSPHILRDTTKIMYRTHRFKTKLTKDCMSLELVWIVAQAIFLTLAKLFFHPNWLVNKTL